MIDAAVIGLGRWGKSLVTAVQGKSQRLRFIHGVSKEPDDVRGFAGQYGFRLSTDLADAIADSAVQAVFLATPHSLHVPQIEAVARARKPVWCEKPLALTRKDAARAVAACREAGIVLGSGNNKRCFASMRELKRVVESGAIGDILHIEAHFSNEHSTRVVGGGWRDDPKESPGGGLTGAGLHVLDALINLGGPIKSVDAKLYEQKPPPDPRDSLAVLVQFASGATGTFGDGARRAEHLARPRVRQQGHGRGARREHADGKPDRRHAADPHAMSRSTRSRCSSNPSPTPSKAARRSSSRPARCST